MQAVQYNLIHPDTVVLYKLFPKQCMFIIESVVCKHLKVTSAQFHTKKTDHCGKYFGVDVTTSTARQLFCYLSKIVFFNHVNLKTIGRHIYDNGGRDHYTHTTVIHCIKQVFDQLKVKQLSYETLNDLTTLIETRLLQLWASQPAGNTIMVVSSQLKPNYNGSHQPQT